MREARREQWRRWARLLLAAGRAAIHKPSLAASEEGEGRGSGAEEEGAEELAPSSTRTLRLRRQDAFRVRWHAAQLHDVLPGRCGRARLLNNIWGGLVLATS